MINCRNLKVGTISDISLIQTDHPGLQVFLLTNTYSFYSLSFLVLLKKEKVRRLDLMLVPYSL